MKPVVKKASVGFTSKREVLSGPFFSRSISVVGTGPLGTMAARTLEAAGWPVKVWEKSRRLGGGFHVWGAWWDEPASLRPCSPYKPPLRGGGPIPGLWRPWARALKGSVWCIKPFFLEPGEGFWKGLDLKPRREFVPNKHKGEPLILACGTQGSLALAPRLWPELKKRPWLVQDQLGVSALLVLPRGAFPGPLGPQSFLVHLDSSRTDFLELKGPYPLSGSRVALPQRSAQKLRRLGGHVYFEIHGMAGGEPRWKTYRDVGESSGGLLSHETLTAREQRQVQVLREKIAKVAEGCPWLQVSGKHQPVLVYVKRPVWQGHDIAFPKGGYPKFWQPPPASKKREARVGKVPVLVLPSPTRLGSAHPTALLWRQGERELTRWMEMVLKAHPRSGSR